VSVKVFVGNLDFATTSDELKALFAAVGEVVEVSVPIDRMTGRPRGFAFVEFTIATDASAAIQRFDGHELAGRPTGRPRTVRTLPVGASADRSAGVVARPGPREAAATSGAANAVSPSGRR
jgi:RNA recognition motif-containing protein